MNNDFDVDAILRDYGADAASEARAPRQRPLSAPLSAEEAHKRERRAVDTSAAEDAPRRELNVLALVFFLLSLAVLVWMLFNVHPGSGAAAVSVSGESTASDTVTVDAGGKVRVDLMGKLNAYLNNDVRIKALENVSYIKPSYTIPESATVAPKPDAAKFGETTDPAEVQAVVDAAAGLLEGQSLTWNPDIALMPGSTIKYYSDETILVICWKEAIGGSAVSFSEIKLADASQFRRALADNTYGSSVQYYASEMAKNVNAVVAMNGDFYAFRSIGLTVYQRQLYRVNASSIDTCFITGSGDLLFSHRGELTSEAEARQFVQDHDVLFSLSFGPILVEDGVLQRNDSYPIGEVDHIYSRSGIGQLGKLHYLLSTLGEQGDYKTRAQLNTFAQYMYDKGCQNAYALDGGQTAVIVFDGTPFNRVDSDAERLMSDIIYFATAIDSNGEVTP